MKNSSKTKNDLLEEISALNRKIHELLQPEAKSEWTAEVLRENMLWQDIIMADLPAGVVIIDPVTRVIESVNQAAATMFGVGAEQIVGHRCHRFLCPAIEGACPVCDLGREVDNAEREMVCAGGGRRPVLKSVKQVRIRGQAKLLECFIDMSAQKQAEEALQESEARVRTITDSVRDAILMMDPEGRIAYWNPAAEHMFGYTREETAGRELHALLAPTRYHEAHYAAFPLFQREGRGGAVGKTLDLEAIRKNGKEIAVQLSLSTIRMKGGWYAVGILRDVTERKRMVEALEKREALLNEMGTMAQVGGWELNVANGKLLWTREVYRIHEVDEGYEPTLERGIGFYAPASRPAIESALQRALEQGEPFDVELEILTARGNHRWVHATGKVDGEGTDRVVSGTFQDVTERRQAQEEVRKMAYHDTLTGLPNRKLFSDRLEIALAHARRNRQRVGIAMLDLDHFKNVNDTLGHDVGDLLLQEATERLTSSLRKGDTVARFGGDEFVLILPDLKTVGDAIPVAQKIVDRFNSPFVMETHRLEVTTSIGIAVYPDDGTDEGSLLKNADIAMYQAKQAGRARYQIYGKT